jgi:hypothetical protein
MSDEGFNFLIHHPDAITILFKYRPVIGNDPHKQNLDRGVVELLLAAVNDKLTHSDIQHFLDSLASSREMNSPANTNHISRIRYFTDEKVPVRATPDEERVCLDIKESLSTFLAKYSKSISSDLKQLSMRLHTALLDAVSLQMIKKTIDKEYALPRPKNPIVSRSVESLLNGCKGIFNKHQEELMKSQVAMTRN